MKAKPFPWLFSVHGTWRIKYTTNTESQCMVTSKTEMNLWTNCLSNINHFQYNRSMIYSKWTWKLKKLKLLSNYVIKRLDDAKDEKLEGKKICIELLQQFREIKGISGAHLMGPRQEQNISEIVKEEQKL